MAKSYEELVQLRQEEKIGDLLFVMDGEYNLLFLDWCQEQNEEPSDDSAARFLEELENDMFENQTNQEYYGFYSL